jgi:hypothetical protein
MSGENANRADLLLQTQSKLRNADHETQTLIQQLGDLQMELMNENENRLSEKVGDIFSSMSRNRETIKTVLHEIEIQYNRLRNEAGNGG